MGVSMRERRGHVNQHVARAPSARHAPSRGVGALGEGSPPMTLDRACVTAAYMSENKAPAARVNGAGGVSALLGRLDLKARHLPHDLRTATLRTLEALCSVTLILTHGRAEDKTFPTFLAEKLIDRHVVSPPSCAILPMVPEPPCLLNAWRVVRGLLLICSGASNQSCGSDGRRAAAARQG